jgi:hypothetical protein
MKKIFFMLCAGTATLSYGEEIPKGIPRIREGNLALKTSQQPGPLFSFGQNTVDKGDLVVYSLFDRRKGINKKNTEVSPSLVYGVTNKFSFFLSIPVAIKLQLNDTCSSGIEDMFIAGEYILHEKETLSYQNNITFIGTIIFPTGSTKKQPPTSINSPGFFMGLCATHLATDWYLFASPGVLLSGKHNGIKFGNQFFYEFGFGKNLAYKEDSFIFSLILEFDGIYGKRNKVCNICDPNSGGNIFTIGPSLWFSTQHLILQAGIAFPLAQHLNGVQNKDKYVAAFNIGWTF